MGGQRYSRLRSEPPHSSPPAITRPPSLNRQPTRPSDVWWLTMSAALGFLKPCACTAGGTLHSSQNTYSSRRRRRRSSSWACGVVDGGQQGPGSVGAHVVRRRVLHVHPAPPALPHPPPRPPFVQTRTPQPLPPAITPRRRPHPPRRRGAVGRVWAHRLHQRQQAVVQLEERVHVARRRPQAQQVARLVQRIAHQELDALVRARTCV